MDKSGGVGEFIWPHSSKNRKKKKKAFQIRKRLGKEVEEGIRGRDWGRKGKKQERKQKGSRCKESVKLIDSVDMEGSRRDGRS